MAAIAVCVWSAAVCRPSVPAVPMTVPAASNSTYTSTRARVCVCACVHVPAKHGAPTCGLCVNKHTNTTYIHPTNKACTHTPRRQRVVGDRRQHLGRAHDELARHVRLGDHHLLRERDLSSASLRARACGRSSFSGRGACAHVMRSRLCGGAVVHEHTHRGCCAQPPAQHTCTRAYACACARALLRAATHTHNTRAFQLGISMARSPRATMTPSVSARISS